jgi:2-oxoglutarate/2-oxoacid ferredoxin oxidoreductase subunit alpha
MAMQAVRDFIIGIGGESGEGVVVAGDILNIAAARMNVHSSSFRTFPAEARGGPSVVKLRLCRDHVYSLGDEYDILITFNEDAYALHGPDLATRNGVLLIDGDPTIPITDKHPELAGRIVYQVPMERIAKKEIGELKSKNIVAVGAAAALFGFSREIIEKDLVARFSKKGEKVLADNMKAFVAGWDFAKTQIVKEDPYEIVAADGDGFLVLSGNEAVALGAVYAGCRFFGGYPITPASEIMEIIAAELPKVGGAMVQFEDEIASIGGVLGASFAGVRSMTSTSGPGMSLMAELIGLGSMAEVPCVIVNVQRGGPSTGLPTKTEQADLNLAIVASHGDATHVVLAPTTIRDCFESMELAFEIAEKYQLPVLVLTDQALGFRRADLPKSMLRDRSGKAHPVPTPEMIDGKFLRYRLTESGISPRSVPGMPDLQYVATGLEHAEDGKPAYDPTTRYAQMDKRQRKYTGILNDFAQETIRQYGDPNPEILVIGWGSTAGPIKEAVELAATMTGKKIGGIVPRLIFPSPNDQIRPYIQGCKKAIVIEGNMTGQYASFLRSQFPGFDPLEVHRYDGLPVRRSDVLQKIMEVVQ